MKALLAFLLLSSAGPADLGAQRSEAVEIVRLVLARPARAGECVSAGINHVTFQWLRRVALERGLERPSGFIGDTLAWEPAPRPPIPRGGQYPELQGEDAKIVANAVRAIADGPELPRWLDRVDPAWLSAEGHFCDSEDQPRRFEISSPTIVGDIAFVGVDFICPLCGHGGTYALRRTESGWRVFAYNHAWVS